MEFPSRKARMLEFWRLIGSSPAGFFRRFSFEMNGPPDSKVTQTCLFGEAVELVFQGLLCDLRTFPETELVGLAPGKVVRRKLAGTVGVATPAATKAVAGSMLVVASTVFVFIFGATPFFWDTVLS